MRLQESAAQAAGGVTAFSRQRQHVRRAEADELAEVRAAMAGMERGSEGDLEDDFLLAATQVLNLGHRFTAPVAVGCCYGHDVAGQYHRQQKNHDSSISRSRRALLFSTPSDNFGSVGLQGAEGPDDVPGPHDAEEDKEEDSASVSGSYTETDFSSCEHGDTQRQPGSADAASTESDQEADRPRRGGPGSIASTYWRPERTDRKNLLTVLDER